MLTQLQQYLRLAASRGRTTTRVHPFLVTVDEAADHPFLNYAIPDDGAVPTTREVDALAAAFVARGRVPRLEYLDETAPGTLTALQARGFRVEGRLQAMIATAAEDVPPPDGYVIEAPEGDDIAAMLAVQNVAYGAPAAVEATQVSRSRALRSAGGIVLAVRETAGGTVVGGGVATPPGGDGYSEVAGIAVAAAHRRRGLATALTAALTTRALDAGIRAAFLTPADDDVARLYARAGYERKGDMLHVRRA